jgi:hypothetical protein
MQFAASLFRRKTHRRKTNAKITHPSRLDAHPESQRGNDQATNFRETYRNRKLSEADYRVQTETAFSSRRDRPLGELPTVRTSRKDRIADTASTPTYRRNESAEVKRRSCSSLETSG